MFIIKAYEGGRQGKLVAEGRFNAVDESLAVTHTSYRFIQYRAVEILFLCGASFVAIEGVYLRIRVARARSSPTAYERLAMHR